MFISIVSALSMLAVANTSPTPQGPNTIAQYNPTIRTESQNGTWMVIPMNFDVVQSVVAPKKLIPIKNDPTKFPNGWPAGTHPVLVSGSYGTYIEQLGLEIPKYLMQANVRIPCTDQLGDGKSCFSFAVADYVGGDNGQIASGAVPATVGSAEGTTTHTGVFMPDGEAISDIGGGQYTFQVDDLILPNPVSGPALAPNAFSFTIKKQSSPSLLTAKGFHYLISQTLILNNGLCNNQPEYFNETFARPFFGSGSATLFPYLGFNGVPSQLSGTFTNGSAYSGNAETLGTNPQDCAQAYAQADPKAQQ